MVSGLAPVQLRDGERGKKPTVGRRTARPKKRPSLEELTETMCELVATFGGEDEELMLTVDELLAIRTPGTP